MTITPTTRAIAQTIYNAQHPSQGAVWLTTVDGTPNVVSYVAAEAVQVFLVAHLRRVANAAVLNPNRTLAEVGFAAQILESLIEDLS